MSVDLLDVENITKHYTVSKSLITRRRTVLRAVDGVSFRLRRGETLALVGESGCGKSTMARLVMRLISPTAGAIRFEGADISHMSTGDLRRIRRRMQIVFQDPFASLNPRMTVGEILEEPLIVNGMGAATARRTAVEEVLRQVGLSAVHAARYPHEFSGGQRQRIGIARALMVKPALVVCDEPVSALDVSIQAQVINLLADLQRDLGLSYLFISHDLAVVKHIASRVAVMYLGKIVEIAPKDSFFDDPKHPYSRALLSAIPRPDPRRRATRDLFSGEIPNPINLPAGCRFNPRCPFAIERCRQEEPALAPAGDGTETACHRVGELPSWTAAPRHSAPLSKAAERRLSLYAERRSARS